MTANTLWNFCLKQKKKDEFMIYGLDDQLGQIVKEEIYVVTKEKQVNL